MYSYWELYIQSLSLFLSLSSDQLNYNFSLVFWSFRNWPDLMKSATDIILRSVNDGSWMKREREREWGLAAKKSFPLNSSLTVDSNNDRLVLWNNHSLNLLFIYLFYHVNLIADLILVRLRLPDKKLSALDFLVKAQGLAWTRERKRITSETCIQSKTILLYKN